MNISYDVYHPVDPVFVRKAVILGRSEREAQQDKGVLTGRPGPINAEIDRITGWFKDNRIRMRHTVGVILNETTESHNTLAIGQSYAYRTNKWNEETGQLLEAHERLHRTRAPYAVALGGVCVRRAACGQGFAYELALRAIEPFKADMRFIDPGDSIASLLLSGALDACDGVAEHNRNPIEADCTVGVLQGRLQELASRAEPNSGIL